MSSDKTGVLKFRTLKVGDKSYNFSYNDEARFATAINDSFLGKDKELKFGVGFISTGIVVNPPIDVEGIKIDTLKYDKVKDRFVAEVEGVEKGSIYWTDIPEVLSPKYNLEEEQTTYIQLMRIAQWSAPGDVSNNKFLDFFNKWKNDFERATGERVTNFLIRDFFRNPYILIWLGKMNKPAWLSLTYTITKDTEKK